MVNEIIKQYEENYTVSATDEIQEFYDKLKWISLIKSMNNEKPAQIFLGLVFHCILT